MFCIYCTVHTQTVYIVNAKLNKTDSIQILVCLHRVLYSVCSIYVYDEYCAVSRGTIFKYFYNNIFQRQFHFQIPQVD